MGFPWLPPSPPWPPWRRLHLRLFASNGPGLAARALEGRHGALVDPAELRQAGDQATPGVLQGPGGSGK